MGAPLGFKTFTTGDVLTAADTNGYLMQGVWTFADATARDAAVTSPQEGNFCYLKDTNATQYYSGSAWVAVGGGGGGKVLQVVYASTSTAVSNSTTTFADTTLTATITPTLATSKVLVVINQNGITKTAADANNSLTLRLLRNASNLIQFINGATYTGTALVLASMSSAFSYLDTPATTSATTYKTQFKNDNASAAVSVQGTFSAGNTSSIVLMEIGV
jgi:hypothetical protein